MKKAIVTGANGFIGSNLIKELLDQNIKVTGIIRNEKEDISSLEDNKNLEIVYCDLNKISELPQKVTDNDIDVFYHFAWMGTSGKDRADYGMQLQNSKYVCDCAVAAKKLNCRKFICAGTITEKIAENILNIHVKSENTIYGIAKHTTHCMLDVLCNKLGIDLVWARLSNIYGIDNTTGNIVSYTLGELKKGRIPEFSKAEQPYDLMYVKDTAKALYLLGDKETRKTCYFIGSGEPRILKKYLLLIKDIYGNSAKIEIGKRQEDGLIYSKEWFQTTDLTKDTGFKAAYTFEQGIKETIVQSK